MRSLQYCVRRVMTLTILDIFIFEHLNEELEQKCVPVERDSIDIGDVRSSKYLRSRRGGGLRVRADCSCKDSGEYKFGVLEHPSDTSAPSVSGQLAVIARSMCV